MARMSIDQFGLIANYGKLMSLTEQYPHLQNLMTAMYNDRNKYFMFLACPVSISVFGPDSEFEDYADAVLTFTTNNKSTWMLNAQGANSIDTLIVDGTKQLVKSYGIELRCYEGMLQKSMITGDDLHALGIDIVIVTPNEIHFGKKK